MSRVKDWLRTKMSIIELERIYGIKVGGDRKSDLNNSNLKNQSDISNQLNIDQSQLINYKKLQNLIPELQSLVEDGEMKATIGYKIWATV